MPPSVVASPIVGFISPPGWYDPTPAEFSSICAQEVRTQQSMIAAHDLNYDDLGSIASAVPEMLIAARMLGRAGCACVAMTGTPFVWAGLSTEAEIRQRCDLVSTAAGVPAVMAGTAIVDALRSLGARKIAVSTPYYTKEWRAQAEAIFIACGFDVLLTQSVDQQGLSSEIASIDDHAAVTAPETIIGAATRLREQAPAADAIVIAGAGVRTLALRAQLEARIDIPIVSSDTALYAAIAQELGLEMIQDIIGMDNRLV